MTFNVSPNIFVPTAESYAKSALATLPYARRTCGYWAHGFQVCLKLAYCTDFGKIKKI